MSYNQACATEDIPDSDIRELSQSQSEVSDSDSDFVTPSSSSSDDLTGRSNSDGTQSDNSQKFFVPPQFNTALVLSISINNS